MKPTRIYIVPSAYRSQSIIALYHSTFMTRYGSRHGRIPEGRDRMIWLAHVSLVAIVGYVMIVRMKAACIYSPICLKYSRCHPITSPVLLPHSYTPSLVLPIHSKPLSIATTHQGECAGYPREVFFISGTPAHSALSHYHRC